MEKDIVWESDCSRFWLERVDAKLYKLWRNGNTHSTLSATIGYDLNRAIEYSKHKIAIIDYVHDHNLGSE